MGIQIVTSPIPHTKLSKINEIHEKGDRGGKMDVFLFLSGVRGRDFDAERPTVGNLICAFRKRYSLFRGSGRIQPFRRTESEFLLIVFFTRNL